MVNWDNAPDWAMWHAFDENGYGVWHESAPRLVYPNWISDRRIDLSGARKSDRVSWQNSISKRPSNKTPKKHSHYHKDVSSLNSIDVYRVLALWDVKDHAIGHAIKKLLNAGQRGSKSLEQDLQEAIDSIQRKLDMIGEDNSD